jgi:hypothetical protein
MAAVPATNQPDGQIFAFAVGQITSTNHAILSPRKGALAIVTERWDGMRWTLRHRARDGSQGGINSVSDYKTRRRAVPKRTAKSCGPDASMVGVKSAEGKSARPGADEPPIRRRRGQQSPIPRGERDINRRAIAQGMSDCLRCPVCSCACSCARLHTRPRVQRASGIPCSLPLEGQRKVSLGQVLPRERGRACGV